MQVQLKAKQIWLMTQPVDFRKAIHGLIECVTHIHEKPIDGAIYIFCNKIRNRIKVLGYHRNGWAMFYKRLDRKKFVISSRETNRCELSETQCTWLLAGFDWLELSNEETVRYEDFF